MTPSPGEIWLADIPFTDGSASKIRPVTSTPPRSATDVILVDWELEGLRVTSTVRLSRLDCMEQILLRRKLGSLSSNDAQRLKEVWTSRIQLRF